MEQYKVGKKVGSWTILEQLAGGQYQCRCTCGAEQAVSTGNLRTGKSKQCRICQYAPSLEIGTVNNGREIVAYEGSGQYLTKCLSCPLQTRLTKNQFTTSRCRCYMKTRLGIDHPASKLIEHDGQTRNINEWLAVAGISREAYRVRKNNGWSEYAALFTPKGQKPLVEVLKKKKPKKVKVA